MATLSLKNINKIYDNHVQAVFDFNLDIKDKEFIVFVGPSGCGKSTTLRMVAGLEDITSGELYIDDKLVNSIAPKDRDVAMVFQNYALYPHMTVYDNMAFALKLRKTLHPLYCENEEVNQIRKENYKLIRQIKKLYRFARKHNEPPETFVEIDKIYETVFQNEEKVNSLLVPIIGIDNLKISELEKTLVSLRKDVERLSQDIEFVEDEDLKKVYSDGLNKKNELIQNIENEIEYLKVNEVPLSKRRKPTNYEIDLEIRRAAQILDLTTYLYRKPANLSGGQRQRVALGRAIVRRPKVFLMDEPLSNLDAKLRVQTRSEIIKIHERVGATTIYVTHDQTEAMTMADRIVVMKNGYIQQIGEPETIYRDPDNIFVAGFIGNPPMNFINGHFDGEKLTISNDDQDVEIKLDSTQIDLLKKFKEDQYDVTIGVRPENIYVNGDHNLEKGAQIFDVSVDFCELLGHELIVYTNIYCQRVLFKASNISRYKSNEKIKIGFNKKDLYFFEKESTKRIK